MFVGVLSEAPLPGKLRNIRQSFFCFFSEMVSSGAFKLASLLHEFRQNATTFLGVGGCLCHIKSQEVYSMVIRKKVSGLVSRLASLWRRLKHPYTPRGFYPTIDSWWAQLSLREQQKHGLRREIFPSQSLNRDLPKTIDSEMYWKFELDYGSVSRPAFVAAIHRGRFWNSSAVITPDNYLLSDTSIYMRIDPENPVQHPVFRHSIPRPVYFEQAIAILSAPGGNSFFHWMIDALPRYELLRQVRDWFDEIDCFIVNDVSHPFQKETLNL